MGKLQQRIEEIENTIQKACDVAGRDRSEITLIAVTKDATSDRAKEVATAGIPHLGENRPEGLAAKQRALGNKGLHWHYIGNLQSRKVRDVIGHLSHLHSLGRISIAKEIQKRATKTLDCFVQVNVSGEASKSGVLPEQLEDFITELAAYDKIRVVGLMTMAPHTDDVALIRTVFRDMKVLQQQMAEKKFNHAPCTELSMGMSNDYTIAIEEGATYLRIGTALVGVESEA